MCHRHTVHAYRTWQGYLRVVQIIFTYILSFVPCTEQDPGHHAQLRISVLFLNTERFDSLAH